VENAVELDERVIRSLELLVGAMQSIAKTMELDYNRKYPPKKEPRDVEITYVKTEEEQLREDQGDTGEQTLQDWTSIGPRERQIIERERERERATASSSHAPGKNGHQ
jgi:hypothetical protein